MILDPIAAAKESEARRPSIFVHEFYYKYRDQPDGTVKQEEWVMIGKRGQQNPSLTPYRYKDILRDQMLSSVVKPAYDAWKSGEETPAEGTPLAAWVADGELVKVLNGVHVRTVEEFADLEDHLMVKLNIPSIRKRKEQAKAFLEARKSTATVSREVAELRDQNESLKGEISELKKLIEQHAIKQETVRRGPGRPRKQPTEDAA